MTKNKTIQVGDKLPTNISFKSLISTQPTNDTGSLCFISGTPSTLDYNTIFKDKLVILLGVGGAFTPVCSTKHIPPFIEHTNELRALGVHDVYVLSTNDAYVNEAWRIQLIQASKQDKTKSKLGSIIGASESSSSTSSASTSLFTMLSDGNSQFVTECGLELDAYEKGMGIRSQRFAALILDGKVLYIGSDGEGAEVKASSFETVMAHLKKTKTEEGAPSEQQQHLSQQHFSQSQSQQTGSQFSQSQTQPMTAGK